MVDWNGVSWFFMAALLLNFIIERMLLIRQVNHVRQHAGQVPPAFAQHISLEEHQKAAQYAQAKSQMARINLVLDAALLLWLTLGGGLQWIFQGIYPWQLPPFWQDFAFVMVTLFALSLVHLPLEVYRTFVLETAYGFNKTTLGTFISDRIKGYVLGGIIGGAILYVLLMLMGEWKVDFWWLYAWAAFMAFQLLLLWAFPSFIAPLFNQFKPLEDGPMKSRIEGLLQKTGFQADGVFVMDGSRRSGHGNAYFTGFGKNKRIVFFDTLLEKLTPDEIEAVLAHELGHFHHGHIKKRLLESSLMMLIGFYLLEALLNSPDFFIGLGVYSHTPGTALMLFMQVLPVLFFWMGPYQAYKSRKDEFEADAFAVQHTSASAMKSALVKLYRDNAATLTPDPLYSAYHDSHPPAAIRIQHLETL